MIVLLFFLFLSGLVVFCLSYKHVLCALLSLEYLILIMVFTMFLFFAFWDDGYYFLILFFVFSVCEGVLGLSILVTLIRCHGNDNLGSINMLSW